jgi:hypothetical protein
MSELETLCKQLMKNVGFGQSIDMSKLMLSGEKEYHDWVSIGGVICRDKEVIEALVKIYEVINE